MLIDGEVVYKEERDRAYKISESVERFYPIIYKKLYEKIRENGKLEFERTRSKEEILERIKEFLRLGKMLGHNPKPSDEMYKYFDENLDIECLVELLNRRERTYMWPDSHHDYRYIEQDLPLADDSAVERISGRIKEWGEREDRIKAEREKRAADEPDER